MSFGNTVRLFYNRLSQQSGSIRELSIPLGSLLHPRSLSLASLPLYFRAAPTPFCAPPRFRFPAKRAISEITTGKPNPSIINTYEKSHFNPYAINTYKNARLKVEQNQHLQKKAGVPPSRFSRDAASKSGAKVPGKGSFRGKQDPCAAPRALAKIAGVS